MRQLLLFLHSKRVYRIVRLYAKWYTTSMETAEERVARWNEKIKKLEDHDLLDDLILQSQTLDALIKGLTGDIEIFKKNEEGTWKPADIVRFTMQLNIMKSKKQRILEEINKMTGKK